MGVLYDYFAAGSDEEAAKVVDRTGGPWSQLVEVGKGDGDAEPTHAEDSSLPMYETVSLKDVDPAVLMSKLESLLTQRSYDEILESPGCCSLLAQRDEGMRVVTTVSAALTGALAAATEAKLREVAVEWSRAEEFWWNPEPDELVDDLKSLATLARNAQSKGQQLYCSICV